MKLYADTSVLVAYYAPEPLSEDAEILLQAASTPTVSDLVEVELFSAVARKTRTGELEIDDARRIRALFLSHLEAGLYHRLPLERRHYNLARNWLAAPPAPLRTLHALHLAAAALAHCTLATADHGLARAGEALGIDVVLLTEPLGEMVHEPRG